MKLRLSIRDLPAVLTVRWKNKTENLGTISKLIRVGVPIWLIAFSAVGFCSAEENSEGLIEKITPLLPDGWAMTANEGRVILERKEKIGLYNGLGLPHFNSDEKRRAYVKPTVVYEKLVITLRLGERVDSNEFNRISKNNAAAIERARADRKDLRFMPDAKFWNDHPNYGYKELPILDTGTKSIYMDCPSQAISRPIKNVSSRGSGRIRAYFDPAVEKECQGLIDAIGERFTPYGVLGD